MDHPERAVRRVRGTGSIRRWLGLAESFGGPGVVAYYGAGAESQESAKREFSFPVLMWILNFPPPKFKYVIKISG